MPHAVKQVRADNRTKFRVAEFVYFRCDDDDRQAANEVDTSGSLISKARNDFADKLDWTLLGVNQVL